MNQTILPENLRKIHFENKELGCGNFLHIAEKVSPYSEERHLWLDRPCRLFTGEEYNGFSLKELRIVVDTYASFYYGAGVRAKDPIAVYVSEGVENLIHYLALNALGAIPTIVNGNMPSPTAAKWIEKVGALGLYSDKSHAALIAPYLKDNKNLKFFVTDESASSVYSPSLPSRYPFVHVDNDPVLVGHSSGTTGIPKAVEFKHQQFFYGIRYRLGLPFPKGSERILSALPHSHSAGIAYLMLAILSGSSTLILSSNKPENVLPQIESFKPSMFVAFPETYVLLGDSDLDSYDLDSIELWFNGGDAAHESHIRRLIEYGHCYKDGVKKMGSVFIDGLGSSEMGFSLFRNVHTIGSNNFNRCIGKPLEWVDAAVLGENGEKLPPRTIGRLGVKSPTITPGYWNDSVLTARSQVNGYFLTGDIFYYDETNNFFHVDRTPDLIQTANGTVYSLQTEEIILKHFEDISDCTVVAAPDKSGRAGAIIVVRPKAKRSLESQVLLKQINALLELNHMNVLTGIELGELKDIPLGPTGKVLKRELREYFKEVRQNA